MELEVALRDYVGRETPLYFAERLTDHYKSRNRGKGPDIYLKREDLNHVGAHKINNAIAQTMLAKRMDCKNIIAATGAGQHGVATAAACAKLSLECTVFMGSLDMERQPSNVLLMKHLGAKVKSVKGSFKDAVSEGIRSWVNNLEISYLDVVSLKFFKIKNYVKNTISHKNGHDDAIIILWAGKILGDNYHGTMSYLLQDEEGQIIGPYSIGVGLEYPSVSPELSFLKDIGHAEFYTVTDKQALEAYKWLCRLEGIFPALEASHALAFLDKLCPTLADGEKVVVNLSGRGDKDVTIVFNHTTKDE
ncbi:tryptophan synthase beta chain 2, chloroplastic-like [Nicotiana tabacum]|uniref:Tryptophan synthase beta chain 2, chloroplastic-like n=1 Tax=Nicotiana tabacum TaxID=4097 RepID=A0AC58S1U7_TOBAC